MQKPDEVRELRSALRGQPREKSEADTVAPTQLERQAQFAETTVETQEEEANSTLRAFPKFNMSAADNSQLVTTHFVTAFLPIFLKGCPDVLDSGKEDPYVNSHFYNDLGFDISSSVPISAATLEDYAKQQLLTRDGGLVNLFVSFAGRDYTNDAYKWGDRKANVDRLYLMDILSHRQPATPKSAMGFISHGLGIKALKTKLEGTGDLGAQGTLFAGIGFDGPLFTSFSGNGSEENKPAGMVSFELFGTVNITSRKSMNALLGVTNAPRNFSTVGAKLQMFLTDNIGIQLHYSKALGSSAESTIGHVAMLTVGYNKPTGSGEEK